MLGVLDRLVSASLLVGLGLGHIKTPGSVALVSLWLGHVRVLVVVLGGQGGVRNICLGVGLVTVPSWRLLCLLS